jgi:hypothetical protein
MISRLSVLGQRLIDTMDTQSVSLICYAFATMQGVWPPMDRDLMDKLLEKSGKMGADMTGRYPPNPQHVGNTVWSLAVLNVQPTQEMMVWIGTVIRALGAVWKPQEVANTLWGLATLGVNPAREDMDGLIGLVRELVSNFNTQDLANVAWAFATLKVHPGADVWSDLTSRSEAIMRDFTPQALSNFIWAFVQLQERPSDHLWQLVCQHVHFTVHKFIPQNLCNFLWAASAIANVDLSLQEPLYQRAREEIHRFSAQNVCNFMQACAKLEWEVPGDLLLLIENRVAELQDSLLIMDVGLLVWSYSNMRIHPQKRTLETLLSRFLVVLPKSNMHDISNVMSGLATLGLQPGAAFLNAIGGRLPDLAASCSSQHCSQALWAVCFFAIADPREACILAKVCLHGECARAQAFDNVCLSVRPSVHPSA